ncbi:MAG: porphobilinogen synthase [Candidatus Dadabacteria bacterium]|nr:MAG: porphobilinogen synthase [Candidatus Dadabacteria bacterium]
MNLAESHRLRRLRGSKFLRELVQENDIKVSDFIYPLFACEGQNKREPIAAMPGIERLSVDLLEKEIHELASKGIKSVLVFGVTDRKDAQASQAYAQDGISQRAIHVIKESCPEMVVMSDVCLCPFTDTGHCGLIENKRVANDSSLELIAKTALSQAQAGADVVAPSAMMDGQVAAIRELLSSSGYQDTAIMAYSAKFASAFYGPFREAANSAPQFGDRKSYQMNPANLREAMREIEADIEQGADIVMVKPGMPYLDVIAHARSEFDLPIAAYNVSGEFSMIKAAAERGWIDEQAVVKELMLSFKRAGTDLIITYFAKDLANWLNN